jgi:uncharacterized membrane protein YhdT
MTETVSEERRVWMKSRRTSRTLAIFKTLILLALMALTAYGMLNRGLFGLERWMPVAGITLGIFFITLFVADYYLDVPRLGWVLIGLLAVLVAVKGLSLTWSVSRTETVEELLRSSMYLATFVLAVASLSTRRFVGPFVDGMTLIAGAVAGYGLLQKIDPVEYPPTTPGGVRIGSTLEYANTVALVLGMGIVLGLARMTQLKRPLVRGLYAALILAFGAALYFTLSRGGILVLGAGLVLLFAVSERRLQMFANLLLILAPLLWLIQRARELETLFRATGGGELRVAEGATFGTDLAVAVVVAFLLQAAYAALAERYELVPALHRALGTAVVVALLAGAGFLAPTVIGQQGGLEGLLKSVNQRVEKTEDVGERLTTLSSKARVNYWSVAWEEWKEHPLTGTGAGTFRYTWLENRPSFDGVRQVHNVYLEQGTETGIVAFLALAGFSLLLGGYAVRATLRASGEQRVLLAGLTGAVAVYLLHSALEWHWYIPPSTLYFFILAGVTLKLSAEDGLASLDEGSG